MSSTGWDASRGGTPQSVPSHASSRRRQVRGDLGSTPGQHTQAAAGRRAQPPNTPGTPSSVGRQHAGGAASVYDATSEVGSAGASVADEALIWGTTIILTQTVSAFRKFLHEFIVPRFSAEGAPLPAELDEEPYYMQVLRELAQSGKDNVVCIDAKHIFDFGSAGEGPKLYGQLIRYPTEVIPVFDVVLNQEIGNLRMGLRMAMMSEHSAAREMEARPVKARVFNLRDVKRMRDLDPIDIDTLVCIRGMVIRTSSPIPEMHVALFRCAFCRNSMAVTVDRGHVEEPMLCTMCKKKKVFELIHNRCTFIDKQYIKIQEAPEAIPEGETPQNVLAYAFDELVDAVVPGDRITLTGVYRANAMRPNPRMRTVRSIFKTYIDVIHFQKTDKGRLTAEELDVVDPASEYLAPNARAYSSITSTELAARQTRVMAMSRDPNLYSNLARSLAPSIWEMEDIKKGILLQLFGGCVKDLGREGKIRGEINILLVGDPGVAKSQLLSYTHAVAARGIYTSGKGSSAVGLTASIAKDPETREPVLESGALVLSDRGVCCIDEFDKMSDTTRVILHEVMEQQTVSIAKAGIIATLNARTSILAAANPVESRYNPRMSVVENIQLPPSLLSRFDLIYLVLDAERSDSDRQLAAHLVSLYHHPSLRTTRDTIPYSAAAMNEYISYARSHVTPTISDEAAAAMSHGYVEMRKSGVAAGKKTIAATARQLESIIRMSEAHARLRLSAVVTADDVHEAIRLINVATQRAAMDPRTGTINMDLITTGHTADERQIVSLMVTALRDLFSSRPRGTNFTLGQLVKELASHNDVAVAADDVTEALRELSSESDPLIRMTSANKVTIIA